MLEETWTMNSWKFVKSTQMTNRTLAAWILEDRTLVVKNRDTWFLII